MDTNSIEKVPETKRCTSCIIGSFIAKRFKYTNNNTSTNF